VTAGRLLAAPPPFCPRPRRHALRDLIGSGHDSDVAVRTLVRLRWIAVVAQTATVLAAIAVWRAPLPLAPMIGLFAAIAVTNLIVLRLLRLGRSGTERVAGAVLFFDVLCLTGLLALSGGPANPFSVLYLIHVMLAAVLTNRWWTWSIVAVSSAGFASLFAISIPLPPELGGHGHHQAPGSYSIHLQGMWLAYTISAATIAAFVSRVAAALRRERDKQERAARLLGLAALAAGAAHEIGNPLATIRIAASELERDLVSQNMADDIVEDVRLINGEVERAKAVLDRLAASAGELTGEALVPTSVDQFVRALVQRLDRSGQRVHLDLAPGLPEVYWPAEATSQAVGQLLRNALQASHAHTPVHCRVTARANGVEVHVRDHGPGMTAAVLERIGEPFFTTRPGQGMGLGVFIARSLIERLGGRLTIESSKGAGTSVFAWLPQAVV
jgi:two-component system, sensor histidine kinase RegB